MDYVSLFQQGGIILVFIGFQGWLVKYFMDVVVKKDETIHLLTEKFDKIQSESLAALRSDVAHQTEVLVKLCDKLDSK